MDGEAGIYYEGSYLGKTYLQVSEASDTLKISLGEDKNVVVRRETVSQMQNKKFSSGKTEELLRLQNFSAQ
ncbi:MAG: hypothetical protein U5L96_01760 [Owenweeksia sp.]|nr:hypothetical protein [Owenweeksia sp.]